MIFLVFSKLKLLSVPFTVQNHLVDSSLRVAAAIERTATCLDGRQAWVMICTKRLPLMIMLQRIEQKVRYVLSFTHPNIDIASNS